MIESLDPAVDGHIRKLVRESGMPLLTFSHAVGERTEDTLSWWANGTRRLSTKNINSLAQYLGISESHLLDPNRSLPIGLIRSRLFSGPAVLPEKYGRQASSYVRSSAHIVEYLSLAYGRHFVDRLLLKMDVHPGIFADLDNKINLLFFMDLLNETRAAGLSEGQVESLACYVFLRIQETQLGREFAKADNYQDCYGIVAGHLSMFDSNFEYRVEIDKHKIQIFAKPTEAERFLRENEPADYERLFRYRRKLSGWFPTLSNLAPVNAKKTKCITHGDPIEVFEFETGQTPGIRSSVLKILGGLE